MKTQKHHARAFDAQIELANKNHQADWKIKQTENGWFIVVHHKDGDPNNNDIGNLQLIRRPHAV